MMQATADSPKITKVAKPKKGKPKKVDKPKVDKPKTTPEGVGRRLPDQGEPIKGLTFGSLADLVPKMGVATPIGSKRIWKVLSWQYEILDFATFKVHPTRGGPFNEPFMQMQPAQRRAWAEKVVEAPPEDLIEHVKKNYKGKELDPVQVFWDLVTLENLPTAVRDAQMRTGHFKVDKGGLEVVKLAMAGKFEEVRERLGKVPPKTPMQGKTVKATKAAKPKKSAPAKPKKAAPAKRAKPATPATAPATPAPGALTTGDGPAAG